MMENYLQLNGKNIKVRVSYCKCKRNQSILNNDISELKKLSTENILKGITLENLSSSTNEDIKITILN